MDTSDSNTNANTNANPTADANVNVGSAVLVELKSLEQLDQVISASGKRPILLDFTASWCGPCRRLSPIIEELCQEYQGVRFFKIDTDQADSELMSQFKVNSLPTVIIMVDRTVVFTMVGAKVSELTEFLKKNF